MVLINLSYQLVKMDMENDLLILIIELQTEEVRALLEL